MRRYNDVEKRRLIAEQTIYRKGFSNISEFERVYNGWCEARGIEEKLFPTSMHQYILCMRNFRFSKMKAICEFLGVRDMLLFDMVFYAPKVRWVGDNWVSDDGRYKIPDIDTRSLMNLI